MSSQSILNWAMQTGLTISVLIAAILLIRRPVTRWFGAGAAYALWTLPVIRLFMPPLTLPNFLNEWLSPPSGVASDLVQGLPQTISHHTQDVLQTSNDISLELSSVIVVLWLVVSAMWLGGQILQHVRYTRNLWANTNPVDAKITTLIQSTMKSLSIDKHPDVRMAQDGVGPMVTRFWKPMIIVPKNFTQCYTVEQQNFALTHEMAHVKRLDLWIAFAVLIFRAVNWPNPLVHYAAHKFRADQEAACDAYLLNQLDGGQAMKQGYARTLIKAAKHADYTSPNRPLGLAVAGLKNYKSETSKGETI